MASVVDDAEYEVIARYTSEAELCAAIEHLTLAGIGTRSEEGTVPDPALGQVVHSLCVVPGDGNRARGVLGLAAMPDEPGTATGRRFPDWVYLLAIFLAAAIIVPAIAFFVTFKLSGG